MPHCNNCAPSTDPASTEYEQCPTGYTSIASNDYGACPVSIAKYSVGNNICEPPSGSGYTCSSDPVPAYCGNGIPPYGWAYTSYYTCDPNLYDGCLQQCPASELPCQYPADDYAYVPNGNCGETYCGIPACNANPQPISACTNAPYNTCSTDNGTQNEQYTAYSGGGACSNAAAPTAACTTDNCDSSAGYTCGSGNVCRKTLSGRVTDARTGAGIPNVAIVGSGSAGSGLTYTDANGYWSIGGWGYLGSFRLSPNTSATAYGGAPCNQGYICTGNSPNPGARTGTIGGAGDCGSNCNFTYDAAYTISGTVFQDTNLNQRFDTSTEQAYTAGSTITITGPVSVTVQAASGVYASPQTLPAGTYTVSYNTTATPLPTGYRFTTPASWQVTVGNPGCSPGASPDASCTNPNGGSIKSLNFGLTNENVWVQSCGDSRFGSGYSQEIPSGASCGGTSAPYALYCPTGTSQGTLFSTNTNPSYGQGSGPSTNNTQVGDFLFPEGFHEMQPSVGQSSYSFVMTSMNNLATPPTPLKNICPDLANCVLSEATPGGVYATSPQDGPVTLSVQNADGTSQLGSATYTFVIGADLTFASKVLLPTNSSAAFISEGSIHVSGSVGESDWTSLSPDLEGFFSADQNFAIDSLNPVGQQCTATGQPKELKLNIVGSVLTNAAGKGGSVVVNRDGCTEDLSCPTATFTTNPLYFLHVSNVLKPPYTLWQEQTP